MESSMHEKIITQLQDSLRPLGLKQQDSLELSLQVLAWVKLSANRELEPELNLNAKLLSDEDTLQSAIWQLTKLEAPAGLAFSTGNSWEKFDATALKPALELALEMDRAGALDVFSAALAVSTQPTGANQEAILPLEVCRLLSGLANAKSGESVYVPWDTSGLVASALSEKGLSVDLESPNKSPLPALISLFEKIRFQVLFSDPIRKREALKQYDVSVAFPPLGLRYSDDVVSQDWHNRFPEKTKSGSVLSVRHLLSQTKRRVVVAVPNNLLFSPGAERSLRDDLVSSGKVECVLSMPTGLLATTNIGFSILVLKADGGLTKIKFLNADVPEFRASISKAKCQLINEEALIKLALEGSEGEHLATVQIAEVLANESQLQVSRYLVTEEQRRLQRTLNGRGTVVLSSLTSTVRPMPPMPNSQKTIEVLEVGTADLPLRGYIASPSRTVSIDAAGVSKNQRQFLHPNDIVLIMKGSPGKVGIVPKDVPPPGVGGWVSGNSSIILRMDPTDWLDPRALFVMLRSELGAGLLKSIVSEATISIIQLRELEKLHVPVPSKAEVQLAIEALEEEARLQKKIDHLRSQQETTAANLWAIN